MDLTEAGGGNRRMTLTKRISRRILGTSSSKDSEEKKDDELQNALSCEKTTDAVGGDGGVAPSFLSHPSVGARAGSIIQANIDRIPEDSLVKMTRQLDFWVGQIKDEGGFDGDDGANDAAIADGRITEEEFLDLTRRLVRSASWRSHLEEEEEEDAGEGNSKEGSFTVPKVRFGRTELQMPIVTCGGMRVQQTWMPDFVPLLAPSKKKVLKGDSQRNLKDVLRACLKVGLNHFETARFYGTSEMQFVDALGELMETGEIKREDFIFQTKVAPAEKRKDWEKSWSQSWAHVGERLGHVDLLSFHGASDANHIKWLMDESDDGCYGAALKLKEEGKIRHIGFSTHGTAGNILKLIESDKFDYVNIHYHFFGSYHGEGTPDGSGGHGNLACVKKALEMDMGVFLISPFDKGGKLYQPSAAVAKAIGPQLTPIAFASLYSWKSAGIHTVSVGFARPSDLDEVLEASRAYRDGSKLEALAAAEKRLADLAVEREGKEWHERGMLGLPDCYEESTSGVAMGHILWLHNLLTSYGMYDFCKDRYKMMMGTESAWKDNKSFEENIAKMPPWNAGRPYNAKVDLTDALANHYDPDLVKKKLAEVDLWLRPGKSKDLTDEERKERGWDMAYSLTVWEEFPGADISLTKVLLQNMTGGRMGVKGTGPSKRSSGLASGLRMSYRDLGSTARSSMVSENSA